MELYFGDPPKFHLDGPVSSPLYQDHVDDMLNYYYRGIMAATLAAKAFGNEHLFQKTFEYSKVFAENFGKRAT